MAFGFSLYEALRPYAGGVGWNLSRGQFDLLTRQVLDTLSISGSTRLLLRTNLRPPTNSSGVRFEVTTSNIPGWAVCQLTADDPLASDWFIVTESGLPLVLTAHQDERYTDRLMAFLSVDMPLVESARVLLAQYHGGSYSPFTPTTSGLTAAGQLIARLSREFDPALISSWISGALNPSATDLARLRAVQLGLSALWLHWRDQNRDQEIGTLPDSMRSSSSTNVLADDTYIRHQVMLPDGPLFEAVGLITDPEFNDKVYLAAGVLAEFAHNVKINDTASPKPTIKLDAQIRPAVIDALNALDWPELTNFSTATLPFDLPNPFDTSAEMDPLDWPQITSTTKPGDSKTAPGIVPGTPEPPKAPTTPPLVTAETAYVTGSPVPSTPSLLPIPPISVKAVNISAELLSYINKEITTLRDRVQDMALSKGLNSVDARQAFQQFVSRSGDLLLLMDEVLYMQRMIDRALDAGDQIDIHDLLGSMVMTYAGEADRRGVYLSYDAPDVLPPIVGNPEALNRALVIVLERAIDSAAPHGRVDIGAQPLPDGAISLFVRDSGTALGDDQISALFVPRFSEVNGTGTAALGFSTVKPIVEAHGGELTIDRLNDMTVIALTLPASLPN